MSRFLQRMSAPHGRCCRCIAGRERPVSHVVIPNFFPADAYADLMQFLPANDEYEVFSYEKHRPKMAKATDCGTAWKTSG